MDKDKLKRYVRNIAVDEIGLYGQEILLDAKVLVVGAGGLGSPVAMYLAAVGIGHIGIVDGDKVDISNLQRQIIHKESDIGDYKVNSAKNTLDSINSSIEYYFYQENLDEDNIDMIISQYDIVADCTDNFPTRMLINKACIENKKILVSGAISGFQGQISTFKAFNPGNNPCYQCFCPKIPKDSDIIDCNKNGILGCVAGIVGSMQAQEIIKEILNIGESLSGKIIFYDGRNNSFRKSNLNKNSKCKSCAVQEKIYA